MRWPTSSLDFVSCRRGPSTTSFPNDGTTKSKCASHLTVATFATTFPASAATVYNLAQALPAIAPDTEFLLLHDPESPNTRYDIDGLTQPNLTLVPTDIPIRSPVEQIRLPRLARRLTLDVFHAPYYITAYRMPCRHVVTIYDVISARYPEYLPSPATRLLFEATTRLALRTADRILTPVRSISSRPGGDVPR